MGQLLHQVPIVLFESEILIPENEHAMAGLGYLLDSDIVTGGYLHGLGTLQLLDGVFLVLDDPAQLGALLLRLVDGLPQHLLLLVPELGVDEETVVQLKVLAEQTLVAGDEHLVFLVHGGDHLGVFPRDSQPEGLLVECVDILEFFQMLLLTVHLVDQRDDLGVLDSGFQFLVARLENHLGVHVHVYKVRF